MGPSLSITVNPANNQIQGVYGISYDANGNQNVGAYDPENRLINAGGVQYAYDAQNRRLWSWAGHQDYYSQGNADTYQIFLYSPSGQKLGTYQFNVYQIGSGNNISYSVCSTLMSSDQYFGGRRLAVMDQLGSAGVSPSYGPSYFPWGEPRSGSGPQDTWNFATYWADSATGLDYAMNRYYSNAYGRFMTPDPSWRSVDLKNPQTWNRYAYVVGDPVNANDPAGLDSFDDGGDGVCPNIALAECGYYPDWPPLPPGATYPTSVPTSLTYPINEIPGVTGSLTVNLMDGSTSFQLTTSIDLFDFDLLPAAAGAGGGIIIIATAPVSWTVIAGGVVIVGASLAALYVIDHIIEARKADLRQFDEAVRRYEKECGAELDREKRRRLHDAITGQGYGIDDIVEEAKALFGCPKPSQGRDRKISR